MACREEDESLVLHHRRAGTAAGKARFSQRGSFAECLRLDDGTEHDDDDIGPSSPSATGLKRKSRGSEQS